VPLSKRKAARERQLANLRPAPPAPPGNQLRRSHGGYSEVTEQERDKRAKEVFAALAEDTPLRDPSGGLPAADTMVVHLLAKCLVRLERVERFHATFGAFDLATKAPRASVDLERRLRMEALDYAKELGMTPRSRVALGIDVQRGMDLARALAELPDEPVDADADEEPDA
jgi:hypothetical protein